ncbi:MAG: hypothetical protein JSU69_00135 [Candidatus Zixiibacteriota bacterium]|nr:MAG: hypothetical protein JSU69_00135 [candidate division Zixibacteria bacterium]
MRPIKDEVWRQCAARTKKPELIDIARRLYDDIIDILGKRIDEVKADDGRAISFFSKGREILTINIARNSLRIYVHPPAQAFFDPDDKFKVERFRFWEGSFQKKTSRYKGLSVWISEKRYLPAVKKIVSRIPNDI